MKKSIQIVAVIVWMVMGTAFLSRWWYANPGLFPPFPDVVWQWLDRMSGVHNIDQASDVEFAVVVFTAFLAVSLVTMLMVLLIVPTCRRLIGRSQV